MKTVSILACALFVCGTVAHAQYDTTVVARSLDIEHVSYNPGDLANAAGIRELQHRVRSAAHRVCQPGKDTFMATYNHVACYHPAVIDALAQVDRAITRKGGAVLAVASITVRAR